MPVPMESPMKLIVRRQEPRIRSPKDRIVPGVRRS